MVYENRFCVLQISCQLIQSILIYSHDEPNLDKCHIEYSFDRGNSFLSIQDKYKAYKMKKGRVRGKTEIKPGLGA